MRMPVIWAAKVSMVSALLGAAVACLLGLGTLSAAAQTVTRPLSALPSAAGAATAARALVVELSAREVLSGVHLELASKVAPDPGAQYVVWVNGTEVARIDATGAVQSITLDFAGLRPNPAPTLAQLPLAFDARSWMPRNVTVVLGRESPSPERLRAAALAVESIATRMRQVDVTVAYESGRAAGKRNGSGSWKLDENATRSDVLLVGTRNALEDVLPAAAAQAIDGPFLGIYAANEGRSVVIVLSGITEADCLRAAQAFTDASTVLPAHADMTLDAAMAIHVPPAHLAMALANPDATLVRAALNFSSVRARATGVVADTTFTLSSDLANTDFFFSPATPVGARLLRQLPPLPLLQPGQAVSVTGHSGTHPFVAVLGGSDAAVGHAVGMLRRPAIWSLFAQGPTIFDTTAESAKPLAIAARTPVARLRLLLADPIVFSSVLATLLALSYVVLNMTLKEQVKKRFDQSALATEPTKR